MTQTALSATPPATPPKPRPHGPEKRRLIRNTGFSVGQQIGAMALAIMLVPYMLWTLGPELYGLWLILQLFNMLGLAGLAELGFQGAIIRYLTRFFFEEDRESFRGVLGGGFALFLGIGLVVGGAIIAFARFGLASSFPIPPAYLGEMQLALTVIGAGLIAAFPSLVIKAYFAARQDLAMTKIWELADRLIFALGVFALLQVTDSLVALIVLEQVIGLGLMAVFAVVAVRGGAGWFTMLPTSSAAAHFAGIARLSGSVFAANFASQGFNRLPELFVSVVLGPVTLTFYQIATRIPRVIKTLQGSLNAAVLPHIAGLEAANPDDGGAARAGFALAGLRINYIIATPLLLAAGLFAPVLLSLWVGEDYRHLALLMALFAAFQLLFLASNYCGATLTQQGHFKLHVRANLTLVGIFALVLALGLERFGLPLVLLALIAAGVLQFAVMLAVMRSAHGIPVRKTLGKAVLGPVVASACLGTASLAPAALWLAEGRWAIGLGAVLCGGCIYLLAIITLILRPDEREQLEIALARLWRGGGIAPD